MSAFDENRTDEKYEKLEVGSVVERSDFLRWLDNFWYHNKWKVIISAFFAVVLITGLVQIFTRPNYDAMVVYAGYEGGKTMLDADERASFEDALDFVCTDYDGRGGIDVYFNSYQVWIESSEYQADKEAAEAESERFDPGASYNTQQYSQFKSFVQQNSATVCLVSQSVYTSWVNDAPDGVLRTLTDIYGGDLPEGVVAFDEYSVLLKDTQFYQHSAVQALPGDTVVCVPSATWWSQYSKKHDNAKDLFRTLVGADA